MSRAWLPLALLISACDGTSSNTLDDTGDCTTTTGFRDADGDGYGDSTDTLEACDLPSTHVADNTDCDDTQASIAPGASEDCADGVDNNCDGLLDASDPLCSQGCSGTTSASDGYPRSALLLALLPALLRRRRRNLSC